ncbi:MAG TPA: hypothetical protein VEY69_09400, partial [Lautropia sp.]|nr:hypothetical protein [Lautropia sp.]
AAQNIRGLTGDLSVGTMTMMVFYLLRSHWSPRMRRFDHELPYLAVALLLVAVFFYPLSLGLTMTDPYAHGYYPTVLSALLLTFFCWAVLARWYLAATALALSLAGFAGRWIESDNLWDYLFDPFLVAAAAIYLASRGRPPLAIRWRSLFPGRFTVGAFVLIAVFLAFAVVHSEVNPDAFTKDFTQEDGFIEWMTSLTLFGAFCFSVYRLVTSHRLFGLRGKFILLLVAFVCLFGAGEEISWGQRVFDIETPASLMERNAQQELNLHNLTFEWNGKQVKVNRLVFGRLLSLALVLYLFVLTPLYRRNLRVRRLVDEWAIPIPATHHIVAYVGVLAVVELLIDSSKRGEMTEFAGAIVFMLNVVFAANRDIYDARHGVAGRTTEPVPPSSGH